MSLGSALWEDDGYYKDADAGAEADVYADASAAAAAAIDDADSDETVRPFYVATIVCLHDADSHADDDAEDFCLVACTD